MAQVPLRYRTAYRSAMAVGLECHLYDSLDGPMLIAGDNQIDFDPTHNTRQALELLHLAQLSGFAALSTNFEIVKRIYVVRLVMSELDTRLQIGASGWYNAEHKPSPERAMRQVIVHAFSDYHEKVFG